MLKQLYNFIRLSVVISFVSFLSFTSIGNANTTPAEETALNQTQEDQGDFIPASLIYGRVSKQQGRYVLGPDDIVEIRVKDLPDFSQKFKIGPDGYTSIYPFGEYYLAGMDLKGLEKWLDEKLKVYLLKPEFIVSLVEMRPAVIYVTGAVHKPGTYQFLRDGASNVMYKQEINEKIALNFTNVLTRAGGLRATADIRNIKIIHAVTQKEETFDLHSFLINGEGEDLVLMPGDKIIVPESGNPMDPETFRLISQSTFYKDKFPVVVLGYVGQQGEVQIDPSNNSLNAALALAGGFLKGAKRDEIMLHRPTKDGKFEKTMIKPQESNIELYPGDVILVSNGSWVKFKEVLSLLTQNTFWGVSATYNLQNIIRNGWSP